METIIGLLIGIGLSAASTITTGGTANFLVASGELLGSALITIFAFLLPVLCFFVVLLICSLMIKKMIKTEFIKKLF